jgi:VWFA-related protein
MRARIAALLVLCVVAVAAQEPPPPQQPPFRTGTNLVRVDVNVTNKHGEPVKDLAADDFEVKEDGIDQPITSFKYLEVNGEPTDDLSLPIRSPEHAAAEAARDDVRVFLLFWDEYHIGQFVPSVRARDQLTSFVLGAFGPTDLVAFMDPLTTLDSIRFTRDRRELANHVHTLQGRRGVYVPPRSALEEGHLHQMRDIESIRAQITTSAIRGALLHLGSLREGRKTLILISETLGPLREATAKILDDLTRTANDTNTAVVTVDPRGLQVGRGAAFRPSDALLSLAYGTGADPVTTNDLEGPLRRIVRQTSAYYLLGYDAGNSPMDGRFHQIKVRVKRDGLEVRARAGYWAPRIGDIARARAAAAAATPPPAVARALADLPTANVRRALNLWMGVTPTADNDADVTIAWSPLMAIGGRTADSVDIVATAGSSEVYAGPIEPHGRTFRAPPGQLTVIVSSRDAAGELIEKETRTLIIPQPGLSTIALSTPMIFRARNPVELRAFSAEVMPPVYAARDFERNDRLRVRITLYGTSTDGCVVSARLLGTRGAFLSTIPIHQAPAPGVYHVDLAASSISRGDFIISIQAEKGGERVERMVPIRIR